MPISLESVYNTLIERGLTRSKVKNDGLHKHRILQGYRGGKYETGNVALLTRKEHRLVHLLLYKIIGNHADLLAYIKLGGHNFDCAGKTFEEIHGDRAALVRHKISIGNSKPKAWWKNGHHSEATKAKIARSNTGKTHTPETRLRLREANLGKKPSEKSIEVFREFARKPRSEEHKRKIGEARKRAWDRVK